MRISLTVGALTVAMLAATQAASAQSSAALYEGPWCAYVSIGSDSVAERCDMRSYEMCRQEITGQGASYCSPNPHYKGAAQDSRVRKVKQTTRNRRIQ